MKQPGKTALSYKSVQWKIAILTALTLYPAAGYGAVEGSSVRLSIINYLFLAMTLMISLVMFFIFQRRFRNTNRELKDITAELSITRNRLNESNKDLEQTQQDLKATSNRYQGMLFNAGVGMFQIDLDGKCTYVNTAMQETTGLYLKRAQQEGLAGAVNPEDRPRFEKAWKAFVEGDEPFNEELRFLFKRGRQVNDVYVTCQIDKVLNTKKEVESYVGWVTDVSPYHQRQLQEQVKIKRYQQFVNETIEGYYRLVPEQPIPLNASASTMADDIMKHMQLFDCSDAFAKLYGAKPEMLEGKRISELSGGCGPFKNKQDLIYFVEDGYKCERAESVKQDPRGNRLSFMNDVVGIIEDNKLVGIWGAQHNVSKQKRETAELSSQVSFLQRILDTLPADVHVKDTRCRYLYASKKLAGRTGITQKDWLGKTILEVMPGTSRDHDQRAIEAMKSGKLNRIERPFEARGQSGWMETIQIPLVSDKGLVEGVVGLSLDITDRKERESTAMQKQEQLEKLLKQTRNELNGARNEYNKTSSALSEAQRKLKWAEMEKTTREHEFKQKLEERKRAEETLRRSEEGLLSRQKQLEEQLSNRLSELETETDKRKKWEELLTIRDDELGKAEALSRELEQQLSETEDFLKSTQEQLIQITEEHAKEIKKEAAARNAAAERLQEVQLKLEKSDQEWTGHIQKLSAEHEAELDSAHKAQTAAEKQLTRTEKLLQKIQEEIKQMTERHSKELEEEVAERKATAEKLIQSMEELDNLREQFNVQLDEQTKAIKQELAQKQIREKTLRQNEKDLEERIKGLEATLQMKSKEFSAQIQAREGAEVQKKQIEQRLEKMTQRQQELVKRETQKLQLHIAEIRLQEVKLRKEVGDLKHAKESLEELVQKRNGELEKSVQKQEGTEALLNETKHQLKQLSENQNQLIAAETESLRKQLEEVKQSGKELQGQLKQIEQTKQDLENQLEQRSTELEKISLEYKQAKHALAEAEKQIENLTANQAKTLDSQTKELHKQLVQKQKEAEKLQQQIDALSTEKQDVEKNLEIRTQDLAKAAREYRKVVDAYKNSQAKIKEFAENQEKIIAEHTRELQAELDALRNTEADLHEKSAKLEAFIDDQKKDIDELSSKLRKETEERSQAEQSLQELQIAVENDKETADELIEKQTSALKKKIADLEETENELQQQLDETRQVIAERDEALTATKTERKQAEERVQEVEQRLAGIRKEHQEDLRKSMAEVKEISRLNGELVDELNNSLEGALNPVVKTSILMEKAENLSDEQKRNLATVSFNCRRLIDMMNYRCELTHIADGSDEVTIDHCDLHGLMTDIDQQFSHRAETKKLFFAVSFAQYQSAHNVPKLVATDESKLRKVLSILLGYAMEQTVKGRLGLHATRKSNSEDSVLIDFELAYTGKDNNDTLLNTVFGPDDESGKTIDVKYGLTLARRYIGMLDGTFKLDYRDGGITALKLQFPFNKVASNAGASSDDEKKAGAA